MDSFLAALSVGGEGSVIGIDMTPEMLDRSRSMAAKLKLKNVEFRDQSSTTGIAPRVSVQIHLSRMSARSALSR